jgi:putative ABC transport system permease protein
MKPPNLIKIALQALGRNKLRAVLTMLGIIIGVAAVITMLAIGQGSKSSIRKQISGMGTNMLFIRPGQDMVMGARGAGGQVQTLTLEDVTALRENTATLMALSPEVAANGQAICGARNWSTSLRGVDVGYFTIRNLVLTGGEPFTDQDVAAAAKVCVIGPTVATNLFSANVDPVGEVIRFNRVPFRIIGVLKSKGESGFGQDQDDLIVAPYTTVQKRLLAQTHIQSIYAAVVSEDQSPAAVREITATLREQHGLSANTEDDFHVRTQQELISTLSSTINLLTILLSSIAGISLLVGGIGIMNIMYVSVTERTREIGLRLAVGARGRDVLMQFLTEAVIISVTGGLMGMALGAGASLGVSFILRWPVQITVFSLVLSASFCTLTGIFFGWYPSLKASRLDPIEALRYE